MAKYLEAEDRALFINWSLNLILNNTELIVQLLKLIIEPMIILQVQCFQVAQFIYNVLHNQNLIAMAFLEGV